MAAHLLTEGDRDADNPLYNVDHLLELWDADPRARAERAALAGRRAERHGCSAAPRGPRRHRAASGGCRASRRSRPPRSFDVAPYARTRRPGHPGREGRRVHRPRRADGLVRLRGDGEPARDRRRRARARRARRSSTRSCTCSTDDAARGELAAAARRAGRELDWDVLARRFEDEVLDRYLPPARRPSASRRRRARPTAAELARRTAPAPRAARPKRQIAAAADDAPRARRAARARAACRAPSTRAIPTSTTAAAASAGSTGRRDRAQRASPARAPAAGAAIARDDPGERDEVRDERRERDAPDAPGPGEHERQHEVRDASSTIETIAIARWRPRAIRNCVRT